MTDRLLRRVLPAGLIVAALAAFPNAASAAECDPTFTDAEGFLWDPQDDGDVSDGTNDAFDSYGYLEVDGNDYPSAAADACTLEDGGREVVYPAAPVGATGLEFSRKFYVPTDDAFGRWLDIIENPTAAPIEIASIVFDGDMGSDSDTKIRATEDGNLTHDDADAWLVSDESFNGSPSDPTVSHVFDATIPAADALDDAVDPLEDEDGTWGIEYQNVTVPAGGTVIYMHAAAQNLVTATQAATDDAIRLSRGPAALYAGLSEAERAALRNFPADGDGDADGVANRADNCADVANSDQADVDADGRGNPCDDDMDGDGLPNGVETAIGTDAAKADTDGDGVGDGADGCPKVAGNASNGGCPGDDKPPTVQLSSPAEGAKLAANRPTTLTATAADDAAVAEVRFIDDAKVVCTDTAAPYTCDYQPKGEDVGRNTLAAVAVDGAGQTAFDAAAVNVSRFKVTRVTAKTSPKSDTSDPRRFTTRGEVVLPDVLSDADCAKSTVRVTFKSGKKTISSKTVRVTKACTFKSPKSFGLPGRLTAGELRVVVRFGGNAVLKPRRAKVHKVEVR